VSVANAALRRCEDGMELTLSPVLTAMGRSFPAENQDASFQKGRPQPWATIREKVKKMHGNLAKASVLCAGNCTIPIRPTHAKPTISVTSARSSANHNLWRLRKSNVGKTEDAAMFEMGHAFLTPTFSLLCAASGMQLKLRISTSLKFSKWHE
jgi:hypothetical protein